MCHAEVIIGEHEYLFLDLFFFNDTATTEIYTLSLHDALPISITMRSRSRSSRSVANRRGSWPASTTRSTAWKTPGDRKSTRLNSSHANISYAVFCLKKKNILIVELSSAPR